MKLILLTISLLVAVAAPAAETQPRFPSELDDYIALAVKQWDVPGMAIAVVRDGTVVVTKGYGVRELGKPAAVDENTVFDIASLAKSFTFAAVATLVDEGKLRWDDPVRRFLPQLEFKDGCRTQEASFRDLLSHRVGLEPANSMFRFSNYDTDEVIRRIRFLEETRPFRSESVYSNVLFTAAGIGAGRAAGTSWEELVRLRLIEPLGMRGTTAGVGHDRGPNFAAPHAILDSRHVSIRPKKAMNILPAGGINSTAKDMARWLLFQLGDGTWEGKRIISPSALAETQSPQTIISTTPEMRSSRMVDFFAGYGMGWNVMDYRGHKMLWHSGNADGMPSYMAILPKEKIGVFVTLNTWAASTLHGAIAARILDVLLDESPKDSSGELLERHRVLVAEQEKQRADTEKQRVAGASLSRPLRDYAGTFNSPLYGDLVLRENEGKLELQFAGGEIADLTHWHYDTFRVRWRDPVFAEFFTTFASFGLNARGEVHRLEMRLTRDLVVATRP